jgi:hypothetical protein
LVDYWHDVSFGQISIAGTIVASGPSADVNGWYTLPITKAQYDALSRTAEVQVCANAAFTDYSFGNLYGVITIFPSSDTGASGGETGNYGQTSVLLGQTSDPVACIILGACVNANLALVNLPSNTNVTYAAHEMGHAFGLHHSRLLSTPTLAYHDGYDIMSAMSVDSLSPPASDPHNVAYGGSILGSVVAAKGPGPDAITLDDEGWIPLNRLAGGPVPLQNTHTLHSLSDPDALTDNPATGADNELLELDLNANVTFPFSPPIQPNCTSNSYTLEYREPVRWDAAIPTEASYWKPSDPNQLKEINSADFPVGSVVMHLVCVSSWDPPA